MDTPPFISLLEKAIEARQPLFDAEHQSASRLFNGFSEGNPDLVIDLYASTLLFHNYADDAPLRPAVESRQGQAPEGYFAKTSAAFATQLRCDIIIA